MYVTHFTINSHFSIAPVFKFDMNEISYIARSRLLKKAMTGCFEQLIIFLNTHKTGDKWLYTQTKSITNTENLYRSTDSRI